MTDQYLPILLIVLISTATAGLILVLNALLGPKPKHRKDFPSKYTPFECGSDLLQDNQKRVSIRFYLLALLFVLFDLEGILLYPWAIVGRSLGRLAFIEIMVFLFFLVVAFFWAYRRKALDWR